MLGYVTVSRLLKWRIFTSCALSLSYLKDTTFYLESKASFIQISSIASFTPFLIAWLWECCTFLDSEFRG